jgi:sec-independent protein translocase protein TatB
MFDIGFTELVLVSVIGLIILGPERMPVAVRTVGLWVGKIKRTIGGVQKEIQAELRVDEIRKKADENRKAIEQRMVELREETEIMEAPVVAASVLEAEEAAAAEAKAAETEDAETEATESQKDNSIGGS